jgi:hypothetical protein
MDDDEHERWRQQRAAELEVIERNAEREVLAELAEIDRQRWRTPPIKGPGREQRLDTAPINWDQRISDAIIGEREHTEAFLVELVAQIQDAAAERFDEEAKEQATQLAAEVGRLTAELGEVRALMRQLKALVDADRSDRRKGPLDLPRLPDLRELN